MLFKFVRDLFLYESIAGLGTASRHSLVVVCAVAGLHMLSGAEYSELVELYEMNIEDI